MIKLDGAPLFVDVYQSIGTLPIDVEKRDVDSLAVGVLKSLCGTAGMAFLYVHPHVRERLQPTVTGWSGRRAPFAFELRRLDHADSAVRFDLGLRSSAPAGPNPGRGGDRSP